ncbi:hypothetical protein SCBWM1_gp23 [Synechococcus phage S-CBWM1]|uniref:Uncharacterized protein n=1 Tax=Synechococcus phage S-CBWM1 TaxID=2053653 RepID=A0A3G1L3E9_9CAUD|nr:hypothetical protein HOU61_gp174 [Synechococcus phage S-CBWM1]ATW62707.1 hypothetical protein SCBWM1_gp23 [Synechococcus phage S-CBWM1]
MFNLSGVKEKAQEAFSAVKENHPEVLQRVTTVILFAVAILHTLVVRVVKYSQENGPEIRTNLSEKFLSLATLLSPEEG